MKDISVRKYTIKRLWTLCDQGVFAVPEIQREFVWDYKRASNLLDSVYRQLPIGSLLVWETGPHHRHLLRQAQEILPPHDDANRKTWFLIDGQQRLAVLYRAKEGHTVKNDRGRELDFSKLCFSFDKRYESRFVFVRRPLPKVHIPLKNILAHNWRAKLRSLPQGKFSEVEKCRSLIGQYDVPVMFVLTSDLEEVREAFLRINSGGLRISKADRAFTRAARLDLRRLMTELRAKLPDGFKEISPSILQSAMALIAGQNELKSSVIESAIVRMEEDGIEDGKVSRQFTQKWRGISDCITKAIDHLTNEFGVTNLTFLPSDNMVAILALFFHANNRAQPNAAQKREIRKWFWATAVARRYAGRGYYQNIPSDIKFFRWLGRQRHGKFTFTDLMPKDEIRRTDYQVSGSLTTAYFLLLCGRKPRYLENGSFIPLDKTASLANRKDKHHLFPKALLRRNAFSLREANSLCNMCYVVAEENQAIGSNRPAVYLAKYRHLKHFASVMKSHAVPYKSDSGLWLTGVRRGYKRFINQRLQLICRSFEKEAGIRLFKKDWM